MKYFSIVKKTVNRIQKMNLIFLLLHRWFKYIKLIQFRFRNYLSVKQSRIKTLIRICDNYAKNSDKAWNSYKIKMKAKLVSEFLTGKTLEHAKKTCKFFNDLGNFSGFGRNYSASSGATYSGFLGRSILFNDLKRPAFKIYSNKQEIYEFVDKCIRVQKKQKIVKKVKILKKVITNKK